MLRTLVLTIATAAGMVAIIALTALIALARAADGYTILQATILFSTSGDLQEGTARPPSDVLLSSNASPEAKRDMSFEWFGIKPAARRSLSKLPIYETNGSYWAGVYDLSNRRVMINQPLLHVFLHEYAHANLHRKSFEEKLRFAVAILRLRWEQSQEYTPYKELLTAVMSEARWSRQPYNPVQEFYAYAAQYSGGDLNRIPGYLRPFFADYLSPGTNHWLDLQDLVKAGQKLASVDLVRLGPGRP